MNGAVYSSFWHSEAVINTIGGFWAQQCRLEASALTGASIDTRTIRPGEIFFAVAGPRFDGHDFVAKAFEREAGMAVVARPVETDGPVVVVDDVVAALHRLTRAYRHVLRDAGVTVIAVGGSNGKTTTRHLIHTVLNGAEVPSELTPFSREAKRSGPPPRHVLRGSQSPASFNNHLGVPLTLLGVRLVEGGGGRFASPAKRTGGVDGDDFVVVEVGTNHPGEIAALTELGQPDVVVITSIGAEHLEYFGDLTGVAREEATLLWNDDNAPHVANRAAKRKRAGATPLLQKSEKLAVIENEACGWIEKVMRQDNAAEPSPQPSSGGGGRGGQTETASHHPLNVLDGWKVVRYGGHEAMSADVRLAEPPRITGEGQRMTLADGLTLTLPLSGEHNAINAIAAITIARRMGVDDAQIARRLAAATGMPGRFERRQITVDGGQAIVIHDAYNANPDSMKRSLRAFAELSPPGTDGRRIVILGDMLELGKQGPALHREVGAVITELGDAIERVVLVGKLARWIGEGIGDVAAHKAVWVGDKVEDLWELGAEDREEPSPGGRGSKAGDAARHPLNDIHNGDLVLLKASRGMRLERILEHWD